MPIGEPFLSVSLQVLFDKLASLVMSELGKLLGVKDELARLQRALSRLQAMLHDAEQKKAEGERFTLWLRELQGAAHDAEDVVEEFEYEDLRRKVQSGGGRRGGMLGELCSCLGPREVSFRRGMARRIDGIRRRLDEISRDKDFSMGGMPDAAGAVNKSESKRHMEETTSYLVDPQVFGRDEVKSRLIKLLLGTAGDGPSSSSAAAAAAAHHTRVSVLSIVGMGGLGKTTLAQWVYHSKEVEEYFDLRVWVCVSHDFDLKRITKQILEHEVDGPQSSLQGIDNLNVLQKNLVKRLRGKRFLVVLDDVWEEDRTKWQKFCAPLIYGEEGSKVLITTRNTRVADTVQSQSEKIELQSLSFDDCWSIFKKHAFPDGRSDEHWKLESIGKAIVEKLRGVPLAVTIIAGALRSELDEKRWRHVLQNELWELEKGGEDILPVLKLSYEHLPLHLKHCFAYCSVFPKGWRFDILDLVQLWTAQGYILPQGRKPVEEVGRDCFNELFNRSLVQFVNGGYAIHELLHDLGRHILQHDYCEIDPFRSQKIPEDANFRCHLLLYYEKAIMKDLEVLYKFKEVRTFFLLDFSWFYFKEVFQIPVGLFDKMKCLRVLDLRYCGIETLPDSVQCLRHLRYLNLKGTPIKCLPETLCALYKLQTLKLEGCDQLNILPKGMSNLISLHYLEAKPELVSSIAGIGKLIHLQNLELFLVSEKNDNKIGDLKDMNELRGKLCIRNLHRVGSRQDAFKAALNNKLHLDILEMEWGDDRDVDRIDNKLEESIIEGLQPPPHLTELIVKCYAGINFPSWINNSSIPSLESFCLHRCINLNPLPHFWQLDFLKTLHVTSCPQIKQMPHLPKALRNLILQDLRLNGLPNCLHDLPLEQLLICQIPRLKELPLLPVSLKELTVEGVGLKALPEFCQCHELSATTAGGGSKDEGSDSRKPSLSILKIRGCPYLTTLREGLLRHHLRHLQVLNIKDCEELVHWPEEGGFRATLCSLKEELTIEGCPKLKALPEGSELHPSLKKLIVKACPRVPNKLLFSQVHDFVSVDVFVEKGYHNLAHCADEALQHFLAMGRLEIEYLQEDDGLVTTATQEESPPPSPPPVSFVYDTEGTWSWEHKNYYMSRNVSLAIKGIRRGWRPVVDVNDAATVDDGNSKLLCTCLGGHVWTSSLRELILDGIPDRAFTGIQDIRYCKCGPEEDEGDVEGDDEELLHHPVCLPSLETLCIWNCSEMRRLPTETLLSHLTALKMLSIDNCPELTLSQVEEGIHSVPSLELLWIKRCPKLMLPPLAPLLNCSDNEDALSGPPPPLPLPPPLPQLRYLCIDDAQLLMRLLDINSPHSHNSSDDNGCFFRDHLLTSLRSFGIYNSEFTSLTAEEEEGLRTLASSLQRLVFEDCPNLQNLPADLRGLLPNLKALSIINCPSILYLPDRELLSSLEFLNIKECPALAEQCRRRKHVTGPSIRGAVEEDDWHKVAHVPVIQIDGVILQGSYSKFLELKANWDFDPL